MHERNPYWLNTFSGKRFDFLDPRPEMFDIVDIAVALANQCRYAGHTHRHYSVAEHSLIVRRAVDIMGCDEDTQRWALMHDAAEAYVTDVPWPLKAAGLVPEIVRVEKRIMAVIAERFGMSPTEPVVVKEVDVELLDLEADAFLARHADWPKGTPREPRPEVRKAFGTPTQYAYVHDITLAFLMRANFLGLATSDDIARVPA